MIYIGMMSSMFGQIQLVYERNIDLWKPYTDFAQDYQKLNDQIYSYTQTASLGYNVRSKGSNNIVCELSYKKINHQVLGVIRSIQVIEYSPGSGAHLDTSFVNGSADLKTVSHSLGLNFGFGRSIFQLKKQTGKIYGNVGIYMFEKSQSEYVYDSDFTTSLPDSYNHLYFQPSRSYLNYRYGFFLSSINFSTYYKHVWQLHENFSLAARVSIGTNVYSDWDQFRKYVWMGVGLELGFGKGRRLGAASNQ